MNNHIILRFRDLITEEEGTINDHLSLITMYGEVWWGWWMKQDETPPIELFKSLAETIDNVGYTTAFLFDTGLLKFYQVKISKILVAPQKNKIGTPNPETSPSYYHRGRYPAWFLVNEILEVDFLSLNLKYFDFPTRPEKRDIYRSLQSKRIESLKELKEFDVTLWNVNQ
jgi:hypothetical protein